MSRMTVRGTLARMTAVALIMLAILFVASPREAFAYDSEFDNDTITATLSASGRLDVTEMRTRSFEDSGRNYISWGILADATEGSPTVYVGAVDADDDSLKPADAFIDAVSIRKNGEVDFRPLEQVAFNLDYIDGLSGQSGADAEGWMFDSEKRILYVFGSFRYEVDITVQYHSDHAVWFGDDCAYLSWTYSSKFKSQNVHDDNIGPYTLDLTLPVDSIVTDDSDKPRRGFVFAGNINCLVAEPNPPAADKATSSKSSSSEASETNTAAETNDSSSTNAVDTTGESATSAASPSSTASETSSASASSASTSGKNAMRSNSTEALAKIPKKDEAYFNGNTVHVATTKEFLKTLKKYSSNARSLELNLVMPRSWFAADATGPQLVRRTAYGSENESLYDDLVEANENKVQSIASDRESLIKAQKDEQQRKAEEKARSEAQADSLKALLNGIAMVVLIFLIGGFILVAVLTGLEFLYQRRPDPRADIEPSPTHNVPDRNIHPLVFDELFYHEYDPELQDFETEILRLAALGHLEVQEINVGDSTEVFLRKGTDPVSPLPGVIDNRGLGILFAGIQSGETRFSTLLESFNENPARTKALFEDWKKTIVEQADSSNYMQERQSILARANGAITGVYIIGALFVSMVINWLIALLAIGVVMGLLSAQKAAKTRIVLTKEGSRLCALGKGYSEWLEHASPEEILAGADERELADRLTYMAVFARSTWSPEKIEQVAALRPDDPRMKSVRACYCHVAKGGGKRLPRPLAKDITAAIDTAMLKADEDAKRVRNATASDDKDDKKSDSASSKIPKVPTIPESASRATVSTPLPGPFFADANYDGQLDDEELRAKAQREAEQAKASLDRWKIELAEARAATPPQFEDEEEESALAQTAKDMKAGLIGFGVLIILVIALAIPMNGASLGLLFPILLIAGIRFVPQLMKNSSKLEDEQQARRDERERAEKHYRDLKNSIPALEQKVAECEQAYNDALRQLSQLE